MGFRTTTIQSKIMKLSAREIIQSDIELIADYWLKSSDGHLISMGVDLNKMPSRDAFITMLESQLSLPYEEKLSYCTIWTVDGIPCGHCNVNKIIFGKHAYMHLHLWQPESRKLGLGSSLVKLSLPFFFSSLKLETVFCEPYALNPAPNNTLKKLGFEFVKEHITIPGTLNFEQSVSLWRLDKTKFEDL